MAREDARGTAKSLREFKQERDAAAAAEEMSRSNRGRNGEQGRILSGLRRILWGLAKVSYSY